MEANRLFSRSTALFLCSLLAVLALPQGLVAQSLYSTSPTDAGTVKVTGTSDLQEWSMTSTAAESQGLFAFDDMNQLRSVSSLKFTLGAETLKSGLRAMDRKAYKALKSGKFPDIRFTLDSAVVKPGQTNPYLVRATGGLTIKGVTQPVSLDLAARVNADGSITLKGTKALSFSDFYIKKPSFMGGVMQAGNDIEVAIALTYSPKAQITLEAR
ncbi:YceI family protein [Rufibacter sp. XAAS-G3-1]|uniref:YceI family protein n=1 Tax=Rufibacter sp. XAAS-G3-1 TaxID=2729134 RepID=UPI0015E6D9CC|nr:YceI family protein [Rufibacter sp. XAAS-G3-1]